MEELYKFMNQSNATLDLKVGSELITEAPEEGAEPLEVHISCHTEAAVTQCASSKLRGSQGLPSHLHAVTCSINDAKNLNNKIAHEFVCFAWRSDEAATCVCKLKVALHSCELLLCCRDQKLTL